MKKVRIWQKKWPISEWAKSERAKSEQAKSEQAKSEQAKSEQAKSVQLKFPKITASSMELFFTLLGLHRTFHGSGNPALLSEQPNRATNLLKIDADDLFVEKVVFVLGTPLTSLVRADGHTGSWWNVTSRLGSGSDLRTAHSING